MCVCVRMDVYTVRIQYVGSEVIKDRQIMKQKKLSCVQAKNVLSTNWLLNMLMLKPVIIFYGCF